MKKITLLVFVFSVCLLLFPARLQPATSKVLEGEKLPVQGIGLMKMKPTQLASFVFGKNGPQQLPILPPEWHEQSIVVYDKNNQPAQRLHRTYESHGLMVSESYDYYTNNGWLPGERVTHSFDEKGWLTESLTEAYFQGQWLFSEKMTANFENLPDLIMSFYTWDYEADEWRYYGKVTFLLNDAMDIVWQEVEIEVEPGTHIGAERIEFTYDSEGNVLTETHLIWNFMESEWAGEVKFEYVYGESGLPLKMTIWVPGENDWIADQVKEMDYDDAGLMNKARILTYNQNEVVDKVEETYSYDADDNLSETMIFSGDPVLDIYRIRYTYDDNRNSLSGIYEQQKEEIWEAYPGELIVAAYGIGHREDEVKGYRYEVNIEAGEGTGLAQTESEGHFRFYPNPVEDILTIKTESPASLNFSLYSMQGQLLLNVTEQYTGEVKLDLSRLAPGIYILKNENKTISVRILKK